MCLICPRSGTARILQRPLWQEMPKRISSWAQGETPRIAWEAAINQVEAKGSNIVDCIGGVSRFSSPVSAHEIEASVPLESAAPLDTIAVGEHERQLAPMNGPLFNVIPDIAFAFNREGTTLR